LAQGSKKICEDCLGNWSAMTVSTPSFSLLLLEVLLFWNPVFSERTIHIHDSSGRQICNSEEGSFKTLSLALIGLSGDGKSTTCRWLTAKATGCDVGHGLESETSQISMVTTPWFGESACGPLTTIDTPGLSDTKNRDVVQWTSTIVELKNRLKELDAVVLVANFAQPRMREERRRMLDVLRRSFGTELWGHLAVLFTHFAWQTDKNIGGSTPRELEATAQSWREYFKSMELENTVQDRQMWVGHNRDTMKATIDSIPFFGVDLTNKVKLAPAGEVDNDMGDIMGLNELGRMRLWMSKTRKEKGPLDLKDVQPRMGPSEVRARQKWQCKYTQRCMLDVAGESLSGHDHLRVFPTSIVCGGDVQDHMLASKDKQGNVDSRESALEANEVVLPLDHMTRRAGNGTVEQRTFDLGFAKMPGNYRICYCEFGSCDHASDFVQDAGILEIYRPSCGQVVCPTNVATVSIAGAEPLSCTGGEMRTVDFPSRVTFACAPDYVTTQNRDFFHGSCTIDGQLVIDNAPGKDHAESCRWAPKVRASQKWQCKYTQRCMLNVAGESLSGRDHLRVFPTSVFCGSEVQDIERYILPVDNMTQRAAKGTVEKRTFDLGVARVPGKYRICYCESGNCDQASHFVQDAGILEIIRPSCGQVPCPKNVATMSIAGAQPISCTIGDVPVVDFPSKVTFACAKDYLTTQNMDFFEGSCTIDGQFMIDNAPGRDHAESCRQAPYADAALLFNGETVFRHAGRHFKCCVSTLNAKKLTIVEIFTDTNDQKKMPKSSRKVPCMSRTGCGCMFGDTWHSYDTEHKKLLEPTCIIQVTKLATAVGMSPMEVITSIATAPTTQLMNMVDIS